MGQGISKLLQGQQKNHLLPFLWVHGEEHAVYREMVKAIHDANIHAFCVEARPHKEFGKQQWWDDLEAILTEAEAYGMRVWILDDKHFPTGYAGGGVEKAPLERHRQHLCNRKVKVQGGKTVRLNLNKLIHPQNRYNMMARIMLLYGNNMKPPKKYRDDRLLSCSAWGKDGPIDLTPYIHDNRLDWDAPAGEWSVEMCSLSRDTGMHRNYINMLDAASCRIQIDEVYQPHYEHFKKRFGNTIAGFFSDEPELGNGNYLNHYNKLGTDQSLPYSEELAEMLAHQLGAKWKILLPLLWNNDADARQTAQVRYVYMDCVTRLVENDFSKQIGGWCDEHGVEYIGHVIEDNNQHARTATSLGHYFRGLKWQTMAGIDDIGGQVYPGGEDKADRTLFGYINDGEFYHYALGKLGSSLGALNPRMQGRTMCEIFGNYGWSEGVRLEKYLVDHFMVRGINHFVPHAFTSKAYPDKDCPPHFYAHGHNPQYRHFGALMAYTNRVCNLISSGRIHAPVAVLYHAEAEWSGNCMMMQKPARILWDSQIDFNFVPADVFSERNFYKTQIGKELVVNDRPHKLLLVPYAQFLPLEAARGIVELLDAGCDVAFVDDTPEGVCTGEELPDAIGRCKVVKLDELGAYAKAFGLQEAQLTPPSNQVRCMHYLGDHELFYLFNEGNTTYTGTIHLPLDGPLSGYDAWEDRLTALETASKEGSSEVAITLEPSKSLLIITGSQAASLAGSRKEWMVSSVSKTSLTHFTQSVCRSIDYPHFSGAREIQTLRSYAETDRKFSGFIRYETRFSPKTTASVVLEITDAYEGVEVFVNGKSAGIQVVPIFRFDITTLCNPGENELVIEVATTLERERGCKNPSPTGITGDVNLFCE